MSERRSDAQSPGMSPQRSRAQVLPIPSAWGKAPGASPPPRNSKGNPQIKHFLRVLIETIPSQQFPRSIQAVS